MSAHPPSVVPSLVAALLLAIFCTQTGHAADLRCSSLLVEPGDHLIDVLDLCGEPVFSTQRVDLRRDGRVVTVDEWVFDLGRNRFRRHLEFQNGRLVRIDVGRKPRRLRY